MKYNFILILFLFASTIPVIAQKSITGTIEGGIMFGATNYSGDVAEKRVELVETRPGFGVFARYHFTKSFSIKAHVYSGSITGDDKNTINAKRKYKFGTSIFEGAVVGEWTLFPKDRLTNTGVFKPIFEPYLFAGIGFTRADPKAEYYGTTPNTDLKVPLPEDNIKTRYLLAPIGAGIRLTLSERFVLGLEGGLRPVFSDDLDGMRMNGNPGSNDWYYFTGLTASIILGGRDY
jgi:OmpA-OmpF porin, OOP family